MELVETRNLKVGDVCSYIVTARSGNRTARKIVVRTDPRSVTFISFFGNRVRINKQRGGFPTRVELITHVELTATDILQLCRVPRAGAMFRERFRRGLAGLKRFGEYFGYAPGEEPPQLWEPDAGQLEHVLTLDTGDEVEIRRFHTTVYVGTEASTVTSWGAMVRDPEYGHPFGDLGTRYRDAHTAEEAAKLYEKHRARGLTEETAAIIAKREGLDRLRLVDYTLDDAL